jgi:hypothetical protein
MLSARKPILLFGERRHNRTLLRFTNSLLRTSLECVCIGEPVFREANLIKRLHPIVSTFLLAAPLLLAQDSQSNNSQPVNIGGAWQVSWQGRNGTQQATMQIQQDGSKLSGTFQDSGGSSPVTGSLAGNNVSFSVQIQGRPMTLAFTGTIDGDKMSGTFQPQGGGSGGGGRGGRGGGGQGNHSWTGARQ